MRHPAGYTVSFPAGTPNTEVYWCRHCRRHKRFDDWRRFRRHLARHHRVARWELPSVIVFGKHGWIYRG